MSVKLYGIDISQHQGTISDTSWADIKEKCNYVIIRLGYRGYGSGGLVLDKQYQTNAAKCKALGIPFGVYFYTQAISAAEGAAEADFIAKYVDPASVTWGIWCDTETSSSGKGRADNLSKSVRTAAVKGFCDRIKALGGKTGIYAGYYWLLQKLNQGDLMEYDIWCPCYRKSCLYTSANLVGWQYSSSNPLSIKGFGSSLDCNVFYKDFGAAQAAETKKEEVDMTNAEVQALITKTVEEQVTDKLTALTDISGTGDQPSDWAKDATVWAQVQGIFQGDGNGNFGWKKPMTREQLAVVLKTLHG